MFESVSVARQGKVEALVLGVFKPRKGSPRLDEKAARRDADGSIDAALKRGECTGDPGAMCEAFPAKGDPAPRVIVVGLGEEASFTLETLRQSVAAAARRLATTRDASVELDLAGPIDKAGVEPVDAGRAMGEVFGLLGFRFEEFRGSLAEGRPGPPKIRLRIGHGDAHKGLMEGVNLAESVNVARRCGATPPNVATPEWMARQAREIAKGATHVKVTVIKGEALERERLNGIRTVGRASANPPCLVRIAYTPSSQRGAKRKPVVLLGKTITYDTGGLSLKTGGGMRGMKGDKDGGCNVLGAMHAIANVIKPDRPVIGLLAAAENSVSDDAYRPDDVLTFRNGVTVEVTNTDAEGRLVLADGLCWACDKEKPEYIVDMATLTGGVVVALGSTFAGMWCDDDDLRQRVEQAAERTGERVWRLPLHQEYRDMMKSSVADIINSSPQRKAHPIQGAAFLSHFVTNGTAWCHLDIAGVHSADSDNGPYVKDAPTGFGVRLLADLLRAG